MIKELPLATPIINTYPIIATPLSIIQLNSKSLPWIYSNFLSLSAKYDKDKQHFGVYLSSGHQLWSNICIWNQCPYINYYRLERWIFEQYEIDIIDYIIQSINHNRYVLLFVKQKEILAYHNTDELSTHDIFIYGYNLEEKTFIVKDYFNLVYRTYNVTMEELRKAFGKCAEWESMRDEFGGVVCFSLPDTPECASNLENFEGCSSVNRYLSVYVEGLDEFLGARANSEKMFENESFYYGIKVIEGLELFFLESTSYDCYMLADIQFIIDFHEVLQHILEDNITFSYEDLGLKRLIEKLKLIKFLYFKLLQKSDEVENTREKILKVILEIKKSQNGIIVNARETLTEEDRIRHITDDMQI